MKIRVTLMTENDKHTDIPDDKLQAEVKNGWDILTSLINRLSEDPSEKVTVESVEVVEK